MKSAQQTDAAARDHTVLLVAEVSAHLCTRFRQPSMPVMV